MASPRTTEPLIMGSAGQAGDNDAIRGHLEDVLASPGFRNSRRASGLLRYVVEHSLAERTDRLKERTIGVEVFGRSPDYDTNVDHSVRSAAGEVRKRLAQYYVECSNGFPLRIELQPGSYTPQFHRIAERAWRDVTVLEAPSLALAGPPAARRRLAIMIGAGLVTVAVAAAALAVWPSPTAFDRFWGPVFDSPRAALLCVGGGRVNPADSAKPLTVFDFEHLPNRSMHVSDATAMALMTGVLEARHKPYRLLNRASATSFQELQQGPVVLIGALNNPWTLRLSTEGRFGFGHGPNGVYITDKQSPADTSRTINPQVSLSEFNRDYAIVSRLRDHKTGQSVVIIGGLLSWGTLAASQFVADPENLRKLDASAPKGWEKKNVQVLIATEVINGSSGPPHILATHYW